MSTPDIGAIIRAQKAEHSANVIGQVLTAARTLRREETTVQYRLDPPLRFAVHPGEQDVEVTLITVSRERHYEASDGDDSPVYNTRATYHRLTQKGEIHKGAPASTAWLPEEIAKALLGDLA